MEACLFRRQQQPNLSKGTAYLAEVFLGLRDRTTSKTKAQDFLGAPRHNKAIVLSGIHHIKVGNYSAPSVRCRTRLHNPAVIASSATLVLNRSQLHYCRSTDPISDCSMFFVKADDGSGSTMTQNQAQTQTKPQAPSAPSIFTNSIGQLSQQQQTVPGVRVSVNELRPTTRFNDLHEELQKIIENIDNFVLDQMRFQSECELAIKNVEDASEPVPNEVENSRTALDAVQQALENDAQAIDEVKKLSNADASNAKLSFNAVATLRLPQQFQRSTAWYAPGTSHLTAPSLIDDEVEGAATSLISYFSNQADEISKTLNSYKCRMSEVEAYLDGLEVSIANRMQQLVFVRGQDGGSKSIEDQVKELAVVLREMESGISGVAGKVTGTREKVQEVILDEVGNSQSWRSRRF